MDANTFLEAEMATQLRRNTRSARRPAEERAAQRDRIRAAAEALRMDPTSFVCWMLSGARWQANPAEYRPLPWLIGVISATRLHREENIVVRLRQGWRLIVTFHGKPFAMIVPLEMPDAPSADSSVRPE